MPKKRGFKRRMKTELLPLWGVALFLLFYSGILPNVLVTTQLPLLKFAMGEQEQNHFLEKGLEWCFPLFAYLQTHSTAVLSIQDKETEHLMVLLEGFDEENEQVGKGTETPTGAESKGKFVDYTDSANASLEWKENTPDGDEELKEGGIGSAETEEGAYGDGHQPEDAGGEAAAHLNMDAYQDFEKLLQDFYVVDKTTYIDAAELNVEKLLGQDMSLEKASGDAPQILIYHTHAHEEYICKKQGERYTVVDAGLELSELLEQSYGFRVLHDTGVYDDVRDYAYAKAAPAIEEILTQYPSIEVVIDLHRDGVAEEVHLVTDLGGEPAAQVMLFNGLSRTKKIGEIEYLKNPNREGNLAFSFQVEKALKENYPRLSRKIYLKGYRYNLHYRPRSLLVELGAQTNTEAEIKRAIAPLAHCIALVLQEDT